MLLTYEEDGTHPTPSRRRMTSWSGSRLQVERAGEVRWRGLRSDFAGSSDQTGFDGKGSR